MQYQRLIQRVLLATLVLCCATARAAEVSWIDGIAGPAGWAIQPDRPAQTDRISFSGPAGIHANVCVAESILGGRPSVRVDAQNKVIELRFRSPATTGCNNAWDPVCGLQGAFGPLDAGSWVFFCTASGAEFYIPFEVLSSRRVYYVDATALGDNTGSNWSNAFVDLQSALAAAEAPGEIRVAQGVYRPDVGGGFDPNDPNAAFALVRGVSVKGGFAGVSEPKPNLRDTVAYETILSGDLYGNDIPLQRLTDMAEDSSRLDNCLHVVVTSGTDETTVLDGVTITAGRALGPETDDSLRCGGGIYNDRGSPIIRDCVITGNAASLYGGGVYTNSYPGPTFVDCVVFGNWCEWWGGGIFNGGSGDVTIDRCVVSSNGARYRGAGICTYNGVPVISNSIISGNIATENYGQGGGFYALQATVSMDYCTLIGNVARVGSAVLCESAPSDRSDVALRNCIIWNDGNAVATDDETSLSIDYCDVEGGWPGTGNIDVYPDFVEMGYWDSAGTTNDPYDDTWFDGDYRLLWDSPCVGAGNPRAIVDPGAMDLYANPRRSGAVVDMGVHEVRNVSPVAVAGPDATGYTLDNTTGLVTLDGTASYDPEGFPLTYRWYQDNELISTEAAFSLELPLGEHLFVLVVNDGAGDSVPLEVTATVHQVIETGLKIWPRKINRRDGIKNVYVTLQSPTKNKRQVNSKMPMILFPGEIQPKGQYVLKSFSGPAVLIAAFDESEFLKAVPQSGMVDIRAIGQLKSGQYFSATKQVRVNK